MTDDKLGLLIERGDVPGLKAALQSDPSLANQTIRWYLNQHNESEPLHYISDCVSHGVLTNGTEGEMAQALLAHGAAIDGANGRESPLIAAVSLGAGRVARVLVDAGAALEATALYGARALHWAAWVGASSEVELLVAHGAQIEAKCVEFGATPLFWAVHGFGPDGAAVKQDQLGAARVLIKAGAQVQTANKHGLTALALAGTCEKPDMLELLRASR